LRRIKPRLVAFALGLSLVAAARAASTSYAATTTGPYKSIDGGLSWSPLISNVSSGLLQGVPNVYAIAVDPVKSDTVYFFGSVTGVSGFYKSTDAGKTWSATVLTGIAGGGTDRTWLCIDQQAPTNLYLAASSKLYRSSNSGATWTELTPIHGTGVIGIAVDPRASGVVFATIGGGEIVKSTDFGTSWITLVKLNYGFPPNLSGIFVDPNNSQRLFATIFSAQCQDQNRFPISCAMFASVDGGQTWTIPNIQGAVRSVAFDRVTGDIYAGAQVVGVGLSVLKSSDQGKTWNVQLKTTGVMNGPAVSADPNVAGNIYALGDTGDLKKTADGGTTWKAITVPRYCTLPNTSQCPSGTTIAPLVVSLAYVGPPPPPAVSAAKTMSAATLQDGPVAPESIVIVNGTHLATGPGASDSNQPQMALAGTTVNVTDAAGITRTALLFSVSQTQVMYQIPPGTATGTANVTITAGDGVSAKVPVEIAAVAPGVYTVNPAGLVKAYVLRVANGFPFIEDVFDIDPSGVLVARPVVVSNGNQVTLIIYGTGFRAAGGDVSATIDGVDAPVLYAGPQGVQPGLDQFEILIPPELGTGSPHSVPIAFTAVGQAANTVYVTVQ
jgi:uncharacterized protein (TIGR03437 family)